MYYRYLGWTDDGIFLFAIKHFLHCSSYFVVLVLYMLCLIFTLQSPESIGKNELYKNLESRIIYCQIICQKVFFSMYIFVIIDIIEVNSFKYCS